LKGATSFAAGTLLLRTIVAQVSLRTEKTKVFRVTAAFTGTVLLAETLAMLYSTGARIYYDYYFYPKIKEHYIMPTRWQGFVEYAVFFPIAMAVLYFSYRFLRYAFRHQPASVD
jgi:hypothetical protein